MNLLISIYILIILAILQMILIVFIFMRLKIIEVTKEVNIVSIPKKEKPFTPIVIKPKIGIGESIINEMKNAGK